MATVHMSAQQTYQGTQYMLNPYAYNPAYAGMSFTMDVNINIRNQYSGLIQNPSTQMINGHLPLYKIKGAAGMKIENEQLGNLRKTGVHASISKIFDSSTGLLAVALQAGVSQFSLDGSQLITPDGTYQGSVINHNDPILSALQQGDWSPQWVLGIYYKAKDFEVGADIKQLAAIPVDLGEAQLDLIPHADIYIQYKKRVNEQLILKPSILLKANENWLQTDFSLLVEYSGNIFGGVSIRGYNNTSIDALAIIGGMRLSEHISLSYSYDAGLSALRRVNEGSHEILLKYSLNRLIGASVAPKIIYNPRNL